MSRIPFGLLLFSLIALSVIQKNDSTLIVQAQEKKKKKDKDDPKIVPADAEAEDLSRVLPVFDPGSHTQPISAMGFSKDKTKFITVGQDFTIQVWSAATGERLDILRLPGYGREKGYDPGRWDIAAVSPDGTFVAIGGQAKFLYDSEAKAKVPARLLLVDVAKRTVLKLDLPTNSLPVEALAFAPDGDVLAIGLRQPGQAKGTAGASLYVVGGLTNRFAKAKPPFIRTVDCTYVSTPHARKLMSLAFSPDGRRLLLGGEDQRVTVWDVPAGVAPQPSLAKDIEVEGSTQGLDWSPDGKQFARAADGGQKSGLRAIELWNADGTKAKVWKADDLNAIFTARAGKVFTVRFLDAKTLYVVGNGPAEKKDGGASLAGTIDVVTGKDQRLVGVSDGMLKVPCGCASTDGSLIAVSVTGNTEVLIGKPVAGAARVRCGVQNQLPYHVGWSKDTAKPGFAWTDERHSGKAEPTADALRFGFDLAKVEPLGSIKGADYLPSTRKIGDWTLDFPGKKGDKDDDVKGLAHLKQGGKFIHGFPGAKGIGHTLVPNGDKPPLVASTNHIENLGDAGILFNADGTRVARLLPQATRIHDMAASPDGRFLIATTGTPRLVVYRTDGSSYPLFSFAQFNGEWVLWTPEGYYAASPGGERMFGWAISNGQNALTTFHPAEKFAKQFRRPDIIKRAIEKGSVALALKELNTKPADVETILPPKAELHLLKQMGAKVVVRASATSASKDKPVTSMRLLLDGIPQPSDRFALKVAPGMPAEAEWEITIPTGKHKLQLKAGNADTADLSEPLVVAGPQSTGQQPTIYRLCVGINDYDESGLRLKQAAKDASDVFAALEKDCVGPFNRFGAAKGELILNKDATCEAILKSLGEIRKKAKIGDLFVFFFAGHGVKSDDAKRPDDFYLLTREAITSKSLKGMSLSGDELRDALGDFGCEVLFIMDACHSAAAVKSFRPATDTLTRTLTSGGDSAAVSILAAAAENEVANGDIENSHFTNALLKALRVERGVYFDPFERVLNAAHIWTTVLAEVRNATNKQQNPTLYAPGSPPIVRDVLQLK